MVRRLVLVLLLVLGTAPLPAAALQRAITVRDFEADLYVHPNGSVVVSERIQLQFDGSWNGFIRTIPVRYRSDAGFGFRLRVAVEAITDDAGRALRYESSREGNNRALKIWVPDAENATRTVVLRYRVENALQFFEASDPAGARDELYWNVTGDEWEMPIRRASARVFLPAGASGVRAVAFTGAYGATEQAARVVVDSGFVTAQSTRAFAPREGLTLAVAWEPGLVQRPGALSATGDFFRGNWYLLIPILVFGGMFRHWYTRGRDPRPGAIMVHYEPPAGLTPGEIGTLVDHSADMRDITATLVDLAVRGYLVIEDRTENKLFGLVKDTEYVFHLARDPSEWPALQPHEQRLLVALFGGSATVDFAGIPGVTAVAPDTLESMSKAASAPGVPGTVGRLVRQVITSAQEKAASASQARARTSVTLSSLENSFYRHLESIRSAIYDRLVARGYYLRRPDHVKAMYIAGGIGSGVLIALGGLWASEVADIEPVAAIVAGVLSGLIILGFGIFMPARTDEGTVALSEVLGFREFLSRVESDRFRRMVRSPEQFERLLPHAMAFGVEDRWAAAFDSLYREPPQWYRGTNPASFRTTTFVRSLNTMSTRTSKAMASQPRSSSGSGFSGGRSGGGRGGGGGRGF